MISYICDLCWKILNEFDSYAKRVTDIHECFMNHFNVNENIATTKTDSTKFFEAIEEIRTIYVNKIESQEVIKDDVNDNEVAGDDVKPTEAINIKMEIDLENNANEMEFVSCDFDEENENESISESDSDFDPNDVTSESKTKEKSTKKIAPRKRRRGRPQMNISIDDNTMQFLLKYVQMKCDLCSDNHEFNNYSDVRVHFLEVHQQKAYFICCNRKFTRIGRLLQHCKFHEDPEAFKYVFLSGSRRNHNFYSIF